MNRTVRLAAAGLAAALMLPSAANAAPANRVLVLTSRVVQRMHGGEIDGRMRLTLTPDGIISGTYQDEDTGRISDVEGGVERDNKVWLEAGGALGGYHFTGTLIGTTIDAVAYHGNDDLHLIAVPAT